MGGGWTPTGNSFGPISGLKPPMRHRAMHLCTAHSLVGEADRPHKTGPLGAISVPKKRQTPGLRSYHIFLFFLDIFYTQPKILHSRRSCQISGMPEIHPCLYKEDEWIARQCQGLTIGLHGSDWFFFANSSKVNHIDADNRFN